VRINSPFLFNHCAFASFNVNYDNLDQEGQYIKSRRAVRANQIVDADCNRTFNLQPSTFNQIRGTMVDQNTLQMTVQIALDESDAEELDALARQLAGELSDLDVESVELVRAGAAPEGTKSAEIITLGAVAVAVLPALLPKMVEFCQAWALRGQGRTVKFKGNVGGQDIEFEGKAEDLQKILSMFTPPPPAVNTV
jgi:hypothetical protein